MNKNCGNVNNPCKICFDEVTKKTGLQCQGACKKWAHFTCLNYTPGKILDIQKGFIKVLCPCPGCDEGKAKEIICWEKLSAKSVESCSKADCPSRSVSPTCTYTDCSSVMGQYPPCPHCPVTKQGQKSPSRAPALPTLPKYGKDIQKYPKKTQSCSCKNKIASKPCPVSMSRSAPYSDQLPRGLSLTVIGSRQKCDKNNQSSSSQGSQSCICSIPKIQAEPCLPKPSYPPESCSLPKPCSPSKTCCQLKQGCPPKPSSPLKLSFQPIPRYVPKPVSQPEPCCSPKPSSPLKLSFQQMQRYPLKPVSQPELCCPPEPGFPLEPCCQPKPGRPPKPGRQPEPCCPPEPCCKPQTDYLSEPDYQPEPCCQPEPGCPPKPDYQPEPCCPPEPCCSNSSCLLEPCDMEETSSNVDGAMRDTMVQLGATVGQLTAKVEELITHINEA